MKHHFVFVTFVQWITKIQLHIMFCVYWNNYIYENLHKHNQKFWILAKCPPCKYWLNVRWLNVRWLSVRWLSVRWLSVRWLNVPDSSGTWWWRARVVAGADTLSSDRGRVCPDPDYEKYRGPGSRRSLFHNSELMWSRIYFISLYSKLYKNYTLLETLIETPEIY